MRPLTARSDPPSDRPSLRSTGGPTVPLSQEDSLRGDGFANVRLWVGERQVSILGTAQTGGARWLRAALVLLTTFLTAAPTMAQAPDSLAAAVRVTTGAGQAATLDHVVGAMAEADVLILGEQHGDAAAHAIELAVLRAALAGERPVVLSLEMVETDAQTVLDEYLAGLIRERDWLAASRPWANYETDYRPLVELARQQGAAVVAANAPGRYVSLVSRSGMEALDSLSAAARAWLPPTVAPPSAALASKFTDLMGGMAHGSGPSVEGMLAAQNLRDATMAWRVADALRQRPGALVVHVNGSFHSAGRLGVPEHLARLRPEARVVVVTMERTAPEGPSADDFVITTAPGETPSHE